MTSLSGDAALGHGAIAPLAEHEQSLIQSKIKHNSGDFPLGSGSAPGNRLSAVPLSGAAAPHSIRINIVSDSSGGGGWRSWRNVIGATRPKGAENIPYGLGLRQ